MSSLWASKGKANRAEAEPLAVRMRPRTLDEFVGQQHFIGEGKLLRRMLDADRLTSVIFFGPPGTGKTTFADAIAHRTQSHFDRANAASVGVKDVRFVLDHAKQRLEIEGRRTIFFLDEIHRFNRAQQDVLLDDVERGIIILIGATTENPYFTINSPLVSRSAGIPVSSRSTRIRSSAAEAGRSRMKIAGYGALDLQATDEAIEHWATMSTATRAGR